MPPEVIAALKRRAARNEWSLEGELRYVLAVMAREESPPLPLSLLDLKLSQASPPTPWSREERGQPLRIVYAFDPQRQAVLILGGDKTGDDRFYAWTIPKAEAIWEWYLQESR